MNYSWWKLDKKYGCLFGTILLGSLIYVLPLILADRYYNDDLARAFYGVTGWNGDGRPLTEKLIVFLCNGMPVADIGPLPLLLSILVLSYSLTIYAKENLAFFTCDYILAYALFLVLANPFMLSNLSYRYDCISMLGGMSIVFLLFSIPEISKKVIFLCSVISGVIIMSLYQPLLGMCISMFWIHIFLGIFERKTLIVKEIIRIVGIGSGAVFYKVFVATHFISQDYEDWRMRASLMVGGISIQSIKAVLDNAVHYMKYIWGYFAGMGLFYKVSAGIVVAILWIYIFLFYISHKRKSGFICVGFVLALPCLCGLSTFLPLLLLRAVNLNSRVLISFSAFTLLIGIFLRYFSEKNKLAATFLLIPCLLFQYSYMYAYGNALNVQKEYETYTVYNIAHDVESINYDKRCTKISIVGQMPRAQQLQMVCDKYPNFIELVPVYLNNSTWGGGIWLYQYMQEGICLEGPNEEDIAVLGEEKPVLENSIYSCFLNGDKIIISFREQ